MPCVLTGNAPGSLLSFSIASYVCGSTSVTGAITGTNPISGRTITSDERWVEGISGGVQVLSGAYGIYTYAPQAISNILNTPAPPIRSIADIVDDVNNGAGGADDVQEILKPQKPNQVHHYASNKHHTYTPQFKEVANKYNLDLDDVWNKELLPHQGRHPNAYHDYVLENMKQFDDIAQGNKDTFMQLYESMKNNIKSNPNMLYKDYWTGK